ncbi:MAG: phosphoribosylformylglycinamidine synthase subunit PurQ [Candidatus Woesearchaeota archaeon]|nr:phosphoribosylformylglycinamidine synthase subunit PurQ [Candidatus Woesearchaeota archaeon]
MVKAYIINGLGIGCHEEAAHAYMKAGAEAEIVHIRQILSGQKKVSDAQIINLSGGFLHGEHAAIPSEKKKKKLKDIFIEYAHKGNVIYGQCNGFQLLVKTGLLPGIGEDYSKQTVTLTHNTCGVYRVDYVPHRIEKHEGMPHFAFEGISDSILWLWCRHGEGKIMFYSDSGLISSEEGEQNRRAVNQRHVLLRYANPAIGVTEDFPYNPNGSVDGIAGLVDPSGNIIGHMAHTEVSIHNSRDPRFFWVKDSMRRKGIKASDIDEKVMEGWGLQIFRNIVNRFR